MSILYLPGSCVNKCWPAARGYIALFQISFHFFQCFSEAVSMIFEDHDAVADLFASLVFVRFGNCQIVAAIAGTLYVEEIILSSGAKHFGEYLLLDFVFHLLFMTQVIGLTLESNY